MTRALLAGLAALLAGLAVATVLAPPFGVPPLDPVGWLAAAVGVEAPAWRVAAVGWLLAVLLGEAVALGFAALWDRIPPRTRPVSKALLYCGVLVLPLLAAPEVLPAAAAFALALGATYRPHPARRLAS